MGTRMTEDENVDVTLSQKKSSKKCLFAGVLANQVATESLCYNLNHIDIIILYVVYLSLSVSSRLENCYNFDASVCLFCFVFSFFGRYRVLTD